MNESAKNEIERNVVWILRDGSDGLLSPWKLVAINERYGFAAHAMRDCVTVYVVPDTSHWGGWHDEQAIRCHGVAVARKLEGGEWQYVNDAAHDDVSATAAAEFASSETL